jgi:hypothetical protein
VGRSWTREDQRLVKAQPTAVRQNDRALDDVCQFAHVTGPIVLFKGSEVGPSQAWERSVQALARQSEEMRGKRGDVLFAVAKGRHLNWKQAQAVVQVFSESPNLHLAFQGTIGCRDDSNVDTSRPFFPDTLELSVLENAQKLCLERKWNFSDFIEEQGPAVGQLKTPHAVSDRTGECALDVTKELALEEVGVNRSAVHSDECAVSPRTPIVNRRRDQFLAGARLTEQEHARAGGRHALDVAENAM